MIDPVHARSEVLETDEELTDWCRETMETLGCGDLAKRVRVHWNPRMRTAAGRAFWLQRSIELNPKLIPFGHEEVWRTLKHELAHLLAYERSPRRRIAPHGAEWQRACADLGIPGERASHQLPLQPRRQARKHAYQCPCCHVIMHRARPIRRAAACMPCCRKFNRGKYDGRFRLVKVGDC